MIETGTVSEIKQDGYIVSVTRHSACQQCSGKNVCFPSENSTLTVSIPRQKELKIGDSIKLEISPKKLVFASFLAYIMPLIFMISFAFLSGLFIDKISDLMRSLWGFAGLAVGFFILWLLNRFLEKKAFIEIKVIN